MKYLPLVLAGVLAGCPAAVLRQRDTYVAEVTFTDRLLREGAPAVRHFVQRHCVCEANVWRALPGDADATADLCRDRVDWWLVYTARWGWHRNMMLFNARLLDVRPGAAPAIPPRTCDLPPVGVD